jgi:hypothetical protein
MTMYGIHFTAGHGAHAPVPRPWSVAVQGPDTTGLNSKQLPGTHGGPD